MESTTPLYAPGPDRIQELLRESVRNEKNQAKKWLLLKPTVQRLLARHGRNRKTYSEIVTILKEQYNFDAFGVDKLKYQLKLWNMGTSLPALVKRTICKAIQRRRAKLDKSTVARYRNQKVDPQILRRWLQEEEAKSRITLQPAASGSANNRRPILGQDLQLGGKIFMNLNLPIAILRSLETIYPDHTSPVSPMNDIIVETPNSTGNRPSPRDAPSPMTVVARMASADERARLFVEGKHFELFRVMGTKEQLTTASWAYELWQYFFRSAKHWGCGPLEWNAGNLRLGNLQEPAITSSAASPSVSTQRRGYQDTPTTHRTDNHALCKWCIHVGEDVLWYDKYGSLSLDSENEPDPEDEASWTPWPTSVRDRSFTETIQRGLEANVFSQFSTQELPIGLTQIIKAVKRSPNELLEEAFGFSIMGRNEELAEEMASEIIKAGIDVSRLHPFHLATTYLDGSKTCCNLIAMLYSRHSNKISVRKLYTNDLGHTVLDNLMITILRSYTSCSADTIDNAFSKNHRFAGEEVDICGRWDADSDCVRQLLAKGNPAIPFEWKHMFCHTSVQAITHCIAFIWRFGGGPDINSPSGLFTQRCPNPECGEKLILFPLHTLVLTAVHLSVSGCKGETLFGVLALLLCLLNCGANPLLRAQISLEALLGHQSTEKCTHEALDPAELANQVPESLMSKWTPELKTGWRILCHVLRDSQAAWRPKPPRLRSDAESMEYTEDFQAVGTNAFQAMPSIYGTEHDPYGDIEMDDAPFTFADDWATNNYQQIPNNEEVRNVEEDVNIDDDDMEDDEMPAYCPEHEWDHNYFRGSKRLGTLWAAVQTELVTYRRLKEGDCWISHNFDMETLLRDLEDPEGSNISIDLVTKNMMTEFCDGGKFIHAADLDRVRMEEASAHDFSNLEKCEWIRRKYVATRGIY